MKKEIIVKDLLGKYGLLDKNILLLGDSLGVLSKEAEYLLLKLFMCGLIKMPPELSKSNELEIAALISELIKKCDADSADFDENLYIEMNRIGFKTDKFYGGHNHNKWNTGTFEDDGFGFGTEPLSLYDDYVDSEYESENKKIR